MASDQYLCLGGTPIVDKARLSAYLSIGLGQPDMQCRDCAPCPDLATGLGYPNGYGIQDAPWYDPNEPESAEFAGLYITSVTGLEPGLYNRPIVENAGIGAVLGQSKQAAPQIVVSGILFARTCVAMEFGYRWLRKALQGSCSPTTVCGGDDLVFLAANLDVFPDADCGPVDLVSYVSSYMRTFKGAALVNGPTISDIVPRGCPSCYECGFLEVTFTLSAADPCVYREPRDFIDAAAFQVFEPDDCIIWDNTGNCTDEADCPTDAACSTDPNCQDIAPPSMPTVLNTCVDECLPAFYYRVFAEVPDGSFTAAGEGTLIISIYAGDEPLNGVQVQVWENPLGLAPDLLSDCDACASISVSYVAAESTLVIDGASRTATINCTGGASQRANPFIANSSGSANFTYPTFICGTDYMVQVTARPNPSMLASVTIQTVQREC